MALRKFVRLPQALILLASSALSIGLAECAFRVFSISHPELSADAIVAGQKGPAPSGLDLSGAGSDASREAPTPFDADQVRAEVTTMVDEAFRTVLVDPDVFGDERTRVLFLGDSFTQGAGLANAQDRFSNVLERRINSRLEEAASPHRLDIFNAGVGGSHPIAWARYFKRIAPAYQPEIVFAIFFLRDGTPLPTSLKMNRATIDPIRARYRAMPAYERSAVLRFLYNKLAWREYSEQFKHRLTSSYVGTPDDTATWRRRQQALVSIDRACKRNGVPFHLVIFPMLLNLDDYEFFDIEDEIIRFARSNGISVFSLTPGFLGKHDRSLWASPTDQHPNIEGHRIAANTLYSHLRDAIAELDKPGWR